MSDNTDVECLATSQPNNANRELLLDAMFGDDIDYVYDLITSLGAETVRSLDLYKIDFGLALTRATNRFTTTFPRPDIDQLIFKKAYYDKEHRNVTYTNYLVLNQILREYVMANGFKLSEITAEAWPLVTTLACWRQQACQVLLTLNLIPREDLTVQVPDWVLSPEELVAYSRGVIPEGPWVTVTHAQVALSLKFKEPKLSKALRMLLPDVSLNGAFARYLYQHDLPETTLTNIHSYLEVMSHEELNKSQLLIRIFSIDGPSTNRLMLWYHYNLEFPPINPGQLFFPSIPGIMDQLPLHMLIKICLRMIANQAHGWISREMVARCSELNHQGIDLIGIGHDHNYRFREDVMLTWLETATNLP